MDRAERLAIVGGQTMGANGLERRDVLIEGSKIVDVGTVPKEYSGEVLNASELLVAPGFIDLQVNGGYGIDLAVDPSRMWDLGAQLVRDGVTSFLPTIVSSPSPIVERAMAALGQRPAGYAGAVPLGLHLEGPMLNPARGGAHEASLLRAPSPELCSQWAQASGVAMVTLAPELPRGLEVTAALASRGVVVAAGHSDATVEEMARATEAGVSHVTHLYNAMSPLRHRRPGLVGFVLGSSSVTAGIIVDGVHSHPAAVRAAWNARHADLALVTDAAPARGLPPGPATLGRTHITVMADRSIRTASGALAGSDLSMDEALRNLVEWTGCELHLGLAAASSTPARILGATHKGAIRAGSDADIVLLNKDLTVSATVITGRLQHRQ